MRDENGEAGESPCVMRSRVYPSRYALVAHFHTALRFILPRHSPKVGKRGMREAAQGARHAVTETYLFGRRGNEYRSNTAMHPLNATKTLEAAPVGW
ncbi:MAG: hypothetical protein LBK01_09040 [Burkholderiaceae bacterium]|nr:hypothetical protein [Burkholderiaceae bacterium]